MFLNKVEEQKLELLRAQIQNGYLKERRDSLDNECNVLAEKILDCQVAWDKEHETKKEMQKEIDDLKEEQDQKLLEMTITKSKINSLLQSLEETQRSLIEDITMSEDLVCKDETIKCLQEQLVNVRLKQAERWVIVRELRQVERELERDKEMLLKKKPESVARLQEDLISVKIREAQTQSDFNNLRAYLKQMQNEVDLHLEEQKDQDHSKSEGLINFSPKGVLWKSSDKDKKNKENRRKIQVRRLKDEEHCLQCKISDLQIKSEIINNQIRYKEGEMRGLRAKLDSARIKEQSVDSIITERKRQCSNLENTAHEKFVGIRFSRDTKVVNIGELSHKMDELENTSPEDPDSNYLDYEDLIVNDLERQIRCLKDRIKQLNLSSRSSSLDDIDE